MHSFVCKTTETSLTPVSVDKHVYTAQREQLLQQQLHTLSNGTHHIIALVFPTGSQTTHVTIITAFLQITSIFPLY
jgi:hypothetical protein